MRNKNFIIIASACAAMLLTSCSGKLDALSADYFTVTPTPLEAQAGQVPATINGTFPEKYMNKKAVVTVTPELRYGNGLVTKGTPATFQGEKVRGNDQTISYKVGGNYTMRTSFPYTPEMAESDLYLTFDARVGSKVVEVPAVKVGYGVVATAELYKGALLGDGGMPSTDAYQRVVKQKQEAAIKFLVNQAKIRKSELETNSISEFVDMLKKINADQERLNIKNVEIQAYASPEGSYDFNNKLSEKRQDVAADYVKGQLKETGLDTDIDAHYTAEDWEGFRQLVAVSDIQDKDVIIRVLEMYKDPEEREQQIRNMSAGYKELADGILPELRRSRMIINYETVGRTDEQILAQFKSNPSVLTIEELLYGAAATNDNAVKTAMYKKATELYPNDARAWNNLATMAMVAGDADAAKKYVENAIKAGGNAEAYANRGLLNLIEGNNTAAQNDIAKATTLGDAGYAKGVLDIAKGNYSAAASSLKGASNSAALALIMNKNYAQAAKVLNDVENPNGMTNYLQAVCAARQGNATAAASYLKEAIQKDPSLKEKAEKDLEFANIR